MTLYQTSTDSGSPFEDTTLEDASAAAAPPPPVGELAPGNAPTDPLESDGSLSEALGGFARGTWQTFPKLFNRKWWWATLLILAGMYGLAQLGVWQLDRLQERRAFNALVAERWQQPAFDLQHETLPADLETMGYRRVEVGNGYFDYANEIALTNQPGGNGEPGIHMITPYVLDDGRAVLVSRGWVPDAYASQENWVNLQEEGDANLVVGLLQRSQELDGATAPSASSKHWYTLNIPQIQERLPYALLPAFILQLPEGSQNMTDYPLRTEPIALDEGSHFSYAIQWFMFAAILGFGYIQLVRWQDERSNRLAQQPQLQVEDEWGTWDENNSSLDDPRTHKPNQDRLSG